jgi:hypothetical protein
VGAVTIEEVTELETSRYIDFPGVGIVDLEAPELPSKVLDVAAEWIFAEPLILETITSISQALHQYERAGGFDPPVVSEAAEAAAKVSATCTDSVADAPAPPPTSEGQEASLSQPVEVAEPTTTAVAAGAAEGVVGEAGSSSSRLVAAGVDEVLIPDEPAAALQKSVAPEDMTRAASPEIQEAEEGADATLLQGCGER